MLPSSLFLTALAVQFIYILVNWYFFRRKEYLFYAIYILTVVAYFLNKYLADANGMVDLGILRYNKLYPDKILIIISFCFYFKFARHFVEAAERYPKMNSFLKHTERASLLYCLAVAALLVFTGDFQLENLLFYVLNIVFNTVALVYVFRTMIARMETLDRFIFTGTSMYGIGAFITLWLSQDKSPYADDHFLSLQIGAILEMVFLNTGLVYKSKRLHNQSVTAEKELIEKYSENQDLLVRLSTIREQISRDLHDDIGATLSSVKAYAEILGRNGSNEVIQDLIRENAAEMIDRLEVISWATNPKYDNAKSLLNAMLKFARPATHVHGISLQVKEYGLDEDVVISGNIRQHLLLIFKEAVNNSIKYAEATCCEVKLALQNQKLVMEIKDNGKGTDGAIKGNGSGWKNMRKRAEEVNGILEIETAPGRGTLVRLSVPHPFKIPRTWYRIKKSI